MRMNSITKQQELPLNYHIMNKVDNKEHIEKNCTTLEDMINKIICNNNLKVFNYIPTNSIDLIITSPPYFNQRDYGKGIGNEKKIEEYISKLIKVFNECVRVVKNNGSIVFNIGDKYLNGNLQLIPYRFALEAIKIRNVKLINDITWLKLNPTPRQYKKRLASSTEPFFHFVKNNKYFYNYNGFLEEQKKQIRPKPNTKIGKKYFDLINRSELTNNQKELAFKELQQVIEEVKNGKIDSFRMKIKGIHSEAFGGQDGGRKYHMDKKGFTIIRINGDSLKKDVIESAVETIKGTKHPAVYPLKVIKEFIKLLTPQNAIVLDPFNGSGTTCLAAKSQNRLYIGIDINEEYCKYAEKRLKG